MATAASLIPALVLKSWLPTGLPNAFGTVNTYSAGTATPVATYTDWTAVTPNPNPLTLNARGEANVYLLPNVAYKIVEADQFGNQIRSTDQVNNSQLITLYGGVDTGSVNAYAINFVANFSAYVDGTVIYWMPSHTNTGASTINVNGLGVVSITNTDGSALPGGTIIVNQMAEIAYKGGSFQLLTPPLVTGGTFTGTFSGFTVGTTQTINWSRTGNIVVLSAFAISNTSNSTALQMTGLPASLIPARTVGFGYFGPTDNSVLLTVPGAIVIGNTGTVVFYKDTSQAAWTAAGTKGVSAFVMTYPLN